MKILTYDFPLPLLVRYVTVGAASALVEVLLFYLFVSWFGFPLMVANVTAVCAVTLFGFLAQKRFTFRSKGPITMQAMLYALQVGINFVLNNALVFVFAYVLHLRPLVAKTLQLGLCFVFNFCFSRFVVFGLTVAPASERVR